MSIFARTRWNASHQVIKSSRSARNLDTIQRIVLSVFSIWKGLRKKRSDKRKGMAELLRYVSTSFTNLIRFLCQKWKKSDFDKSIIVWNTGMTNSPIHNEPGKGTYVLIFILNERAVFPRHKIFRKSGLMRRNTIARKRVSCERVPTTA